MVLIVVTAAVSAQCQDSKAGGHCHRVSSLTVSVIQQMGTFSYRDIRYVLHKAGVLFQGRYSTPLIFRCANKHINLSAQLRHAHRHQQLTSSLSVSYSNCLANQGRNGMWSIHLTRRYIEFDQGILTFHSPFSKSHIPATNLHFCVGHSFCSGLRLLLISSPCSPVTGTDCSIPLQRLLCPIDLDRIQRTR